MASLAFPTISKKTTLSDGTVYGYVRVTARDGKPTLLFLHGYPSSSYDWRPQIEYFSKQGFGLVVPDLLGYGDTSKPTDVKAYTMGKIGKQVAELLDQESLSKVVGIGHDWGCGLMSSMVRQHGDRFSAFVFCAVGYLGESFGNIDQLNEQTERSIGYPVFGYWKFHEQKDAGALIDKHPESYTSVVYPDDPEIWKREMCPIGRIRAWVEADKRAPRPSWISEGEEAMHKRILAIGGYDGPLNWYKQEMLGYSAAEEAHLRKEDRYVNAPLLYVRAEKDLICLADIQEAATRAWAKYFKVASMDTTHWLNVEKPQQFNKIVEDYVNGLGLSKL